MGFYKDTGRKTRTAQPLRWLATVAVSALIGSGATFGLLPVLQHQSSTIQGDSSSTQDTSYVTNTATQNLQVQVSDSITQVFKSVSPSVVAVVNYANVSDFFTQQSQMQESGVGSGLLFYKDSNYGYIVTNNHVVEGAAKLEAVLSSGQHVKATLVGTDPYTDLAVIKLPVSDVKSVQVAHFANSDSIQVGEPAIAIGTPMGLDFAESVTAGIVSGKQRLMPVEEPETQQTLDYQNAIQTDAAINPGNSGGPLLNVQGEVIGINSSKIAASSFEGMGFAIPSNEVQEVAKQLMKTGHVAHPALGFAGYSLSTMPQQYWPSVPVDYGVYIQTVTSAAAKAGGLKAQDVIVALNGQTVQDMADLRTALFKVKPGDTVKLKVYRGNNSLTLSVKVGQLSSTSTMAPSDGSSTSPFTSDPSSGGDPFGLNPQY